MATECSASREGFALRLSANQVLTCCNQVLQNPRRLAPVAVANEMNGATRSPFSEISHVHNPVAVVVEPARMFLAVTHGATLELIKYLARPVRPRR